MFSLCLHIAKQFFSGLSQRSWNGWTMEHHGSLLSVKPSTLSTLLNLELCHLFLLLGSSWILVGKLFGFPAVLQPKTPQDSGHWVICSSIPLSFWCYLLEFVSIPCLIVSIPCLKKKQTTNPILPYPSSSSSLYIWNQGWIVTWYIGNWELSSK